MEFHDRSSGKFLVSILYEQRKRNKKNYTNRWENIKKEKSACWIKRKSMDFPELVLYNMTILRTENKQREEIYNEEKKCLQYLWQRA